PFKSCEAATSVISARSRDSEVVEATRHELPGLAAQILAHRSVDAVLGEVTPVLRVIDVQALRALDRHAVEHDRACTAIDGVEHRSAALPAAGRCRLIADLQVAEFSRKRSLQISHSAARIELETRNAS